MGGVGELSIVDGWVPLGVLVLGLFGFGWLIIYPRVRYLLIVVPAAVVVTVLATVVAQYLVEKVWRPFPEPISTSVYAWGGVALLGSILLVARFVVGRGVIQKVTTVIAGVLAITLGLAHINMSYDAYPTVDALLGDVGAEEVSLAEVGEADATVVPIGRWHNPAEMSDEGRILTATIPGTRSGFEARPAEIYLPPAVFTSPTPRLPVVVLMAGQPGAPDDWFLGGQLGTTMNAFARSHDGLSPIVVVADATGTELGNPLCMDSKLGNAARYLTVDVAAWVRQNLSAADTDRRHWAAAGLSYGGTCALQLATNHPGLYPTFLDISGQLEPTLGDRQRTIDVAFGGDAAAFRAVNPMDLMATRRYPDSAGAFVVGSEDVEYRAGLRTTYRAARRAGMDAHYSEVPGGHTFAVWSAGFRQQLPWLAERLGIPR
ncbi:alpha/beta hydrolase [Gordonia sp. SL306]|uniref:alpha/beta hydrolase n=1 Tax=Gordonia sp. SL306 TaxID=2995145 RepID=UPI0022710E0A|nr:alpha/beta hydrolase-fold protein [Gordonia sp. SL306]WAC56451.1 alpha/beta hydrolase-fold protein [Gordonia sp. SL306]